MTRTAALLLLALAACGDADAPAPTKPSPTPEPPPKLSAEAEQWIETMLTSKDVDARTAALAKVETLGDVVIRRMIQILDEDTGDDGTGAWAAEVLIRLGPKAAPAAEALAQQLIETTECNATTSTALQAIGEPAIPHLIRALDAEIPASRQWAANAIGNLTEHEAALKALPRLIELITDPDGDVRSTVLFAIRDFEMAAHPQATKPLLALLDDTAYEQRTDVIEALTPLINHVPEVKARIQRLAKDDPDKWIRGDAKDALGRAEDDE